MKLFSAIKLAVCLGISVAIAGVFLQRRVNSVVERRNNYEVSQRATVLIKSTSSQGTGVVVRRQNTMLVWTAAHVVNDCDEVIIQQFIRHAGARVGHTQFSAKIIFRSDPLDVALLWLIAPPDAFSSVNFAEPDPLKVGDSVYHVGNFWGDQFDGSVSTGVISQLGVRPSFSGWLWAGQLDQTTAFVVYGSSGGGIFRSSDNTLVGIIVGGPQPGVADINLFVPVREMLQWAKSESISWAMYGTLAPDSNILQKAADIAKFKRISLLPKPVICSPPDC